MRYGLRRISPRVRRTLRRDVEPHLFSYGGIARETDAQERQPGTPVGEEKIVTTVCIFVGATRAPPVAGGDIQGPCSIIYSSSTKRRESGPSLKRNLSFARCLVLVCDSPSKLNRVETLILSPEVRLYNK